MVLRRWLHRMIVGLLVALSMTSGVRGEEGSDPGEVQLPLSDYLALVARVEAAEKAQAQREARREAPVAEVTAQRVSLVVGEDEPEVNSELDVLVQGDPAEPVFLPLSGISERVEVTPATASVTAVTAGKEVGGGALLVAPAPGKYVVKVHGRLPVARDGGVGRLALAPVVAPVAEIQADLPAGTGWSSPGTVAVDERVDGDRRRIRLAAERGKAAVLELRRHVDGSDADRLLARAVVLTLFQLRPDGARRHDVIFYEVSRGGLGSFTVDLPPGLDVEQVGTDEGSVVPVTEAQHLTVQRQKQLQGTGYLVITSTPAASSPGSPAAAREVPFAFVQPGIEVRARYLALATSVAAEVQPVPEKSWARVDLDDLPPALREALGSLDLSAAWRLLAAPPGLALAVMELPKAPALEEVVRLRETTTLVTVDGTVLHRDRFTFEGGGEAFDLALPEGATLWTARVGDQPVRPVERNGRVAVPLGFESGPAVVEVVSVLRNKIPAGRSRLDFELARVDVPVLDHRWRLLLPENARYRFQDSSLRPVWNLAGEAGAQAVAAVAKPFAGVPVVNGPAPAGTAIISGRVTDEKGNPLPDAVITVNQQAAGLERAAKSAADGSFIFVSLAVGNYEVTVTAEGRQPEVFRFRLGTGEVVPVSAQLVPGQMVSEEITVTAGATALETTVIGQSFDLRRETKTTLNAVRVEDATDSVEVLSPYFATEAESLRNGLVGGVKPLPVTIPETGKILVLTGVLPPAQVIASLEVKARK